MRLRHRWIVASSLGVCLTALAVPSAVYGYKRLRDAQHRASITEYLNSSNSGEEVWTHLPEYEEEAIPGRYEETEEAWDEPLRRTLALKNYWGSPTPSSTAEWVREARREAQRWGDLLPKAPRSAAEAASMPGPAAPLPGLAWVNLGPTNANFQYNGSQYPQVDSGRAAGILVHPADPSIVYFATSGGGIWKTFNFGVADPTWFPITESLGNIAIGAMDMDRSAPETLYVGLGDFIDQGGGQMVKTTDGGATWSAPVTLAGTYASGLSVTALRVRDVKVDPANPSIILVGTDVGLFRSTNAGASYALVDLPNSTGTTLAEAVWSIVYTGQVGGVSRWAVSGVYASAVGALPPLPSTGTASNPGDIWISTDAGGSWSSRKAAGAIPATSAGRIQLAAGTPSTATPPVTVIYAEVGAATETATGGIWRSTDSGATFIAANGTLRNPTTTSTRCTSTGVNGSQSWYNDAIAVDPANNDRVIVGGVYCGVRTLNGTSASPVWENVSYWLPTSGTGDTAEGRLPYVHADWQEALIVRIGTGYRVFAGSDGGLFYSDNVFDPASINETTVTWSFPNRGIVTHLAYSVASGDPADGNPSVAFFGLQDNGTRFRDPTAPTTFNQVIGGDGIGATLSKGASLTAYWGSVNGTRRYCTPAARNCNSGPGWNFGWNPAPACTGDAQSFFVRMTGVPTSVAEPAMVTITNLQVWRVVGDPDLDTVDYVAISPCAPTTLRNIYVSPVIDGLYGAPTNSGKFWVTGNCTIGNNACTWTHAANSMGFDANGDGTITTAERIFGASALSFPPVTPPGKSPGDVYVATSVSPQMSDGSPVNPAVGRIFITQDRGTTWAPLHGNGTGFDLPSVPINAVQYDPGDATNNTLYVGTDLGVYRTTDGGQTWRRYGTGLPLVRVNEMFIGRTGGILRIGTYGRGMWEIYPSATAEKGVNGNGDFDRNQLIDFRDLAAMSSRIGTNLTTAAQPLYDWNMDMVGSSSSINENDLDQLLTRFGGRP